MPGATFSIPLAFNPANPTTQAATRYRLRDLLAKIGDVNGNKYDVLYARRLQIQVNSRSPGGAVFIGAEFVTPTNCGIELGGGMTDDFAPGNGQAHSTSDWLCTDTALQLIKV